MPNLPNWSDCNRLPGIQVHALRYHLTIPEIAKKEFFGRINETKDGNLIGQQNKIGEYCMSWAQYREGKLFSLFNYSTSENLELAPFFAGMATFKDAAAEMHILQR